jgi:hypothetical protein
LRVTAQGLDPEIESKIDDIRDDTSTTIPGLIADIDGGGGGLTGPFTRTVTVTDADTDEPIEGAKVRLYRAGETGTVATDSDGVASFTVEAAMWSYAITASGYTGISGSVVVSANGNTDVQMEASVITTPTPSGTVRGILTATRAGTAASGVIFSLQLVLGTGAAGNAPATSIETATSDNGGGVVFPGLVPGRRYRLWGGNLISGAVEFKVPGNQSSDFTLPEVLWE